MLLCGSIHVYFRLASLTHRHNTDSDLNCRVYSEAAFINYTSFAFSKLLENLNRSDLLELEAKLKIPHGIRASVCEVKEGEWHGLRLWKFYLKYEAQCKPIYIPFSHPNIHPHLPPFKNSNSRRNCSQTHWKSVVAEHPMMIKFIPI